MKFISTTFITFVIFQTLLGYIHSNSIVVAAEASTTNHHHDQQDDQDDHRFIIKFKDNSRFESANQRLFKKDHATKVVKILPEDVIDVMILETEEDIKYWEQHGDVEYVERDARIYLQQSETVPWGITAVKALKVSDDNVSNQKVCIIDTGYDINHPDLPSSLSIVTGTSQIPSELWTEDGNGHGTHVAGTIAGLGGNSEGVVGVNRNGQLKLHIVKMFDNNGSYTYTSNSIQAVESCAAAGSTVVSMSWGSGYKSTAAKATFDRISNDGVLLVAASGNGGSNDYLYPASYPSVISVGAIDSNFDLASFSQYNDEVDVVAPGVEVLSTIPGGRYELFSGTSMATPHVAGIAALLWSHFETKSAQEIRDAIESTAKNLGPIGRDDRFGHGLVQADLAYDCLAGGECSSGKLESCEDYPAGWHDSFGSGYDCNWYANGMWCGIFGDKFRNKGKTANEACCVCGGGREVNIVNSESPSMLPTMDPSTSILSRTPSPIPTLITITPSNPDDTCVDSPLGWHDSDGPDYDCSYYARGKNCENYGHSYRNQGKTANEACCVCSNRRKVSPSVFPTINPSSFPSSLPSTTHPTMSPPPSSTPSAMTPVHHICEDSPIGWYDSDGPDYDCNYYSKKSNCKQYGDDFRNQDKTANEACCVCGGGVVTPVKSSKSPSVLPITSPSSSFLPSIHPTPESDSSSSSPTIIIVPPDEALNCYSSSCTEEVLNRILYDSNTVGETIEEIVNKFNYTNQRVCFMVCGLLYPEICSECNPY